LPQYNAPEKVCLLLGSEVDGIDKTLLELIPLHLEIPMFGKKESFNVVEATSMALYHFRFC
jgi:tRNA G18 (ribose-2'-O)-methylase SpoU